MINDIQKTAEGKMQRSLEVLKENLAKVRTGRAHTGLLDQVEVEYWGSMVPVSQVANVTLLDARTIGVKPFESNMASKVEKAIRDSNLGLNPASVGDLIRVPMPMLTEERRKDLIKVVRGEAEEGRVSIRNVRRDANDHIKKLLKDKEISEDEARRGEEAVQKLTDKYIAEADKLLAAKRRRFDGDLILCANRSDGLWTVCSLKGRHEKQYADDFGTLCHPPTYCRDYGRQRTLGKEAFSSPCDGA